MARRSVFLAAVCLLALVAAASATDLQMESEMEAEMGAEVQLPGFREQIAQQLRYFSQGTTQQRRQRWGRKATRDDEQTPRPSSSAVQCSAAQRSQPTAAACCPFSIAAAHAHVLLLTCESTRPHVIVALLLFSVVLLGGLGDAVGLPHLQTGIAVQLQAHAQIL